MSRCETCTEKCPQLELADECAKGRMYATKELIECQKELQAYKDKQEQGLLIELPCKVGDTVYRLTASKNAYYKTRVSRITIYEDSIWVHFFNGKGVSIKEIGKTVFLTEAEAEEALARMKGE